MSKRSFIRNVLTLGAASLLGLSTAKAQNPPPSPAVIGAAGGGAYYSLNNQTKTIVQGKTGVDYLIDADLTSILYAYVSEIPQVKAQAGISDDDGYKGILDMPSFTGRLSGYSSTDGNEHLIYGQSSDSPILPYRVLGSYSVRESLQDAVQIEFTGNIAKRDIKYTLTKSGDLPIRIEGVWAESAAGKKDALEIIVEYTPSSKVKWLADHADVTLRNLETKVLEAKYRIQYEFTQRKLFSGTAIGYSGFTVTRLTDIKSDSLASSK